MTMNIIELSENKFGLYDYSAVGPYDTPLVAKGTLEEVLVERARRDRAVHGGSQNGGTG